MPQYDAHIKDTPYYPMAYYNGVFAAKANRRPPTTDVDLEPTEFRRFVNASGSQDVQLENGMRRRTGQGRRMRYVTYLYAATPQIPGQTRDDYGGKVKHGIGPLEYQNYFRQGPGSQPQNPGGVRQISGDYLYNPGTS